MSQPPTEQDLLRGLAAALQMYLDETPLRHAVGETGVLRVNLEVFLERGHAQWSKGGVGFERRVNLGGRS